LEKGSKGKLRMYSENIGFSLEKKDEEKDANGMLRLISERHFEVDENLCACFIEWQNVFHRVNWSKLMQIPMETAVD
jgi:hypothetical protein